MFTMSDDQRSFPMGKRTLAIAAVALAAIAILGVIGLVAIRGPGHSSVDAIVTPGAKPTCSASGCAVVNLSRTLPPFTVFYGASCSGVHGIWFFNAVEGGGNDQFRPSYSLHWTFTPGSTIAKPSARIVIAPTDSAQVTLTLDQGSMSLTGTRKPNVQVAATGTLVVELSGPTSAPVLKFTETGLSEAESALGLVSPFDAGGQPLTVPVKTVKTMVGC
jgi:hypothetical protein